MTMTMSESARMTTAAEAAFRIDAPNSQPRNVKVIALDGPSERVVKHLAGRTKSLVDEIDTADLVVMIAASGENAHAAALVGEACSLKHVMTTALILGSDATTDEALSKSLTQLRPHVMMLVISNADEYIEDMLAALRA